MASLNSANGSLATKPASASWSDYHRLRKYRKRKLRRWDDKVALLYWRYHFKVFGGAKRLWNPDDQA